MKSLPRAVILSILALTSIGGCDEDTDVLSASSRWPDSECHRLGEDFQVDPRLSTDAALQIFRNQVLPRARSSGRTFPAYQAWLNEMTDSVRRHEQSDGGDASDNAQL